MPGYKRIAETVGNASLVLDCAANDVGKGKQGNRSWRAPLSVTRSRSGVDFTRGIKQFTVKQGGK